MCAKYQTQPIQFLGRTSIKTTVPRFQERHGILRRLAEITERTAVGVSAERQSFLPLFRHRLIGLGNHIVIT